MITLPKWMRVVMLAAVVLNTFGAVTFMPSATGLREMGGLPSESHPLYMAMLGTFILIFGLAYLWCGVTGKADRVFIAVAGVGKLSFFVLLVLYAALGTLPTKAVTSGFGDLIFGSIFLFWLYASRTSSISK